MRELWSQEQINTKISPEEFHRIGIFLSTQEEPKGMNVAGVDSEGKPVAWEVEEFQWIPAESVYAVLKLASGNLYVEGKGDLDGVKVRQVFCRKRMVPVYDYVDLKTIMADPGVSTTFG